MGNIASDGHFSDSLEVFDSPQTNSEDRGDYKPQGDPGKHLEVKSLQEVKRGEVENTAKKIIIIMP